MGCFGCVCMELASGFPVLQGFRPLAVGKGRAGHQDPNLQSKATKQNQAKLEAFKTAKSPKP